MLTTAEVATLLRRTRRTIYNWEKAGLLTRAPIEGRVLFHPDQIEALLGPTVQPVRQQPSPAEADPFSAAGEDS